jgi:predicted transcriptional regulator of viral defense system
MKRLTEIAWERSHAGVFTRAEVAAWLHDSADAEAAIIKRALASGEVIRVCRGIYSLAPRYRTRPVDSLAIAQRILGPSYVSLESALTFHGWLPEAVESVTSVCSARSREFRTALGTFRFSRVPQARLFADIARVERADGQVAFIASPLKAVADYVYVHRLDWRGLEPLVESLRVPPEMVAGIEPDACEALAGNYRSRRVTHFLAGLAKEALACRSR